MADFGDKQGKGFEKRATHPHPNYYSRNCLDTKKAYFLIYRRLTNKAGLVKNVLSYQRN